MLGCDGGEILSGVGGALCFCSLFQNSAPARKARTGERALEKTAACVQYIARV